MAFNPLAFFTKRAVGIDIGTFSIKIVELSRLGDKKKLENYGELSSSAISKSPFRSFERKALLLSTREISQTIKPIIEEAKIKTKKVVLSIPDFSTFYTAFDLPPMTEEELPAAVQFTARRYIPIPLSEVTLDWRIIEGEVSSKEKTKLKILLVAIPKKIINQYKEIAVLSGLDLFALDAEVFGLVKALPKKTEKLICLIDIGDQSTTISIVEEGILKMSYSFDISGEKFTKQIAETLSIGYNEARELKEKYGLRWDSEKNVAQILYPMIDFILIKIGEIFRPIYQEEKKEISKIVLAGGSAKLPYLKEYFSEQLDSIFPERKLKTEVEIINPFYGLSFPLILSETLKEMGPDFAIAAGMAIKGVE